MVDEVAGLIDRDRACLALQANTQRLLTLLRRVHAPDQHALGKWTIRDVVKHLTWGIENYAPVAQR